MVKHLNENENLKEIIQTGIYIVDFYANWCGPCKMLGPILEELEEINIVKVDIDIHQKLATEYGIMSVPTLLFTKDGNIIQKEIGFKDKEELIRIYNSIK